MRYIISFAIFILLLPVSLVSQTNEEGVVTFTSSKNVYVKFKSTQKLSVGDTLLMEKVGTLTPALVIKHKSSTSTVCTTIGDIQVKKGDKFLATIPKEIPKLEEDNTTIPTEDDALTNMTTDPEDSNNTSSNGEKDISTPQKLKTRISAASYTNLSDFRNRTRMRYTLSFRGDNLGGSKFSTASYINYHHNLNEPEAQPNLAESLKVYSLYGQYDFNKTTSFVLGRKVNTKFSSVGAIDGVQFEKQINRFQFGAIGGFRPNLTNYAPDFNLFQYGAFVGLGGKPKGRSQQTTLGFMEQRNAGAVDRRYLFFQHMGELAKNLNLFSSMEVDLYQNISDTLNVTRKGPQLTSLYVSLRYRATKNFRVSASYDNRRNIIYYESYKSFIDQLITDETRQGLRLGFVYRPWKYLTWSVNSGMRFQANGTNNAKNINTNISYSRIPYLNMRGTVNFTYLQTDYLNSFVYGVRLSKELVNKRLRGDISYRWVNYNYMNSDSGTKQHIPGINLSLTITKQLNLHLYYEGAFDQNVSQTNHRINTKLILRF